VSCFSASTAARTLTLKLSGGSPTTTAATRRKCGRSKRCSKSWRTRTRAATRIGRE
jgi:hypothetical protein